MGGVLVLTGSQEARGGVGRWRFPLFFLWGRKSYFVLAFEAVREVVLRVLFVYGWEISSS